MNERDLLTLRTEILSDPLTRGYAGMSPAQRLTDINTIYRTFTRTSIGADAIRSAIVAAEYIALSTDLKIAVGFALATGSVDLTAGSMERTVLQTAFGAGSDTRAAIIDLVTVEQSRAAELGFGTINIDDMTAAGA